MRTDFKRGDRIRVNARSDGAYVDREGYVLWEKKAGWHDIQLPDIPNWTVHNLTANPIYYVTVQLDGDRLPLEFHERDLDRLPDPEPPKFVLGDGAMVVCRHEEHRQHWALVGKVIGCYEGIDKRRCYDLKLLAGGYADALPERCLLPWDLEAVTASKEWKRDDTTDLERGRDGADKAAA